MADLRTRLRVFVASPSDTASERARLPRIIEEVNAVVGDKARIVLELVRWETHSWPGVGEDAQDVINQQVGLADIYIGIFWKRIGTPTGRAESGTVEEIERAMERHAHGESVDILVYFNQSEFLPAESDVAQFSSLLAFRRDLVGRGAFIGSYSGMDDFDEKVRRHLGRVVRQWESRLSKEVPIAGEVLRQVDVSRWLDQLQGNSLQVQVDPSFQTAILTLTNVLAERLHQLGFNPKIEQRAAIALVELVGNCRDHTSGAAIVKIGIQPELFRSLVIEVGDTGNGFELTAALLRELTEVEEGKREHGLLRICRHVDELTNSRQDHPDASERRHTVRCCLFDFEIRPSLVDGFENVSLVQVLLNAPTMIRVVDDVYPGESFQRTVLMTEGSRQIFLDRYFHKAASESDNDWLALEVTGDGADSSSIYAFHAILSSKFVSYFSEYIARRNMVIYVHNCDWYVGAKLRELAVTHSLHYFTSESKFRLFLEGLHPGSLEPGDQA